MKNLELVSFKTDIELAEAAARRWLAAIPSDKPWSVALSGGRITRTFFARVAALPEAAMKLRRVHFFWADERCVPRDDPESNYRIAQELLFAPLNLDTDQIHRIKGEAPPEEAAREAERDMRKTVSAEADGQPVLDLILLGMGEDGHVASLFPGETSSAMNDPAVYRAVTAVKPPPRRITLGYPAIFTATEAWVLASGAGKEAALRESLSADGTTPLARVIQRRRFTTVFTDIEP